MRISPICIEWNDYNGFMFEILSIENTNFNRSFFGVVFSNRFLYIDIFFHSIMVFDKNDKIIVPSRKRMIIGRTATCVNCGIENECYIMAGGSVKNEDGDSIICTYCSERCKVLGDRNFCYVDRIYKPEYGIIMYEKPVEPM